MCFDVHQTKAIYERVVLVGIKQFSVEGDKHRQLTCCLQFGHEVQVDNRIHVRSELHVVFKMAHLLIIGEIAIPLRDPIETPLHSPMDSTIVDADGVHLSQG